MKTQIPIDISIVVPVYNEAKNLPHLHEEIAAACNTLGKSFEIIFIDDGSLDNSFFVLKQIQKKDPSVKLIKLRKNFGQTAALSAGFDHTHGEIVITMDADLQNDPMDIQLFLNKMDEGYDIVSGWRRKRKDKLLSRRLPTVIANWLLTHS